ncbi:hypothetical protein HDU84_005321 [Entophlyctis sp. JEL0112]|nr:hypothetical protein HDU84_005321 [Entophlyctis sp. JEL0112]
MLRGGQVRDSADGGGSDGESDSSHHGDVIMKDAARRRKRTRGLEESRQPVVPQPQVAVNPPDTDADVDAEVHPDADANGGDLPCLRYSLQDLLFLGHSPLVSRPTSLPPAEFFTTPPTTTPPTSSGSASAAASSGTGGILANRWARSLPRVERSDTLTNPFPGDMGKTSTTARTAIIATVMTFASQVEGGGVREPMRTRQAIWGVLAKAGTAPPKNAKKPLGFHRNFPDHRKSVWIRCHKVQVHQTGEMRTKPAWLDDQDDKTKPPQMSSRNKRTVKQAVGTSSSATEPESTPKIQADASTKPENLANAPPSGKGEKGIRFQLDIASTAAAGASVDPRYKGLDPLQVFRLQMKEKERQERGESAESPSPKESSPHIAAPPAGSTVVGSTSLKLSSVDEILIRSENSDSSRDPVSARIGGASRFINLFDSNDDPSVRQAQNSSKQAKFIMDVFEESLSLRNAQPTQQQQQQQLQSHSSVPTHTVNGASLMNFIGQMPNKSGSESQGLTSNDLQMFSEDQAILKMKHHQQQVVSSNSGAGHLEKDAVAQIELTSLTRTGGNIGSNVDMSQMILQSLAGAGNTSKNSGANRRFVQPTRQNVQTQSLQQQQQHQEAQLHQQQQTRKLMSEEEVMKALGIPGSVAQQQLHRQSVEADGQQNKSLGNEKEGQSMSRVMEMLSRSSVNAHGMRSMQEQEHQLSQHPRPQFSQLHALQMPQVAQQMPEQFTSQQLQPRQQQISRQAAAQSQHGQQNIPLQFHQHMRGPANDSQSPLTPDVLLHSSTQNSSSQYQIPPPLLRQQQGMNGLMFPGDGHGTGSPSHVQHLQHLQHMQNLQRLHHQPGNGFQGQQQPSPQLMHSQPPVPRFMQSNGPQVQTAGFHQSMMGMPPGLPGSGQFGNTAGGMLPPSSGYPQQLLGGAGGGGGGGVFQQYQQQPPPGFVNHIVSGPQPHAGMMPPHGQHPNVNMFGGQSLPPPSSMGMRGRELGADVRNSFG